MTFDLGTGPKLDAIVLRSLCRNGPGPMWPLVYKAVRRGVIVKTISWKIEGMRCGACARTIEARLIREPGVRQAEVTYPTGTARILLDPVDFKMAYNHYFSKKKA